MLLGRSFVKSHLEQNLILQIVADQLRMNSRSMLEVTLRDILRAIEPSREDWSCRFHVISKLRVTVESIESLRGATVEPFGSFASNLFTRWGDLDISIELPNGSYISTPGRKHKQSLLGDVLKALRKKGGFHRIKFISNARVPILKFDGGYSISCDISINNLSGQMKSKLLFWINGIDGRFRELVLLVKEWAKAHHINDSKSGSLNSYCLSLLVVFHLQTLEPAILPPLRDVYPGNMIDDLTGVRAVAEKRIEDIVGLNINRINADKSRLINRSSLPELFISFFAKFSDICSRASAQGVSPYTGQLEDIEGNMRWLPRTYSLFVEDPFEQPVNTGRTVSSHQLIKIAEAVRETYEKLVSPVQNRSSIISLLVGPHISQSLTRAPASNPANPQPNERTPNNRRRNGLKTQSDKKHNTSQMQHQPQNGRKLQTRNVKMDKHPNRAPNESIHNVSMDKHPNRAPNESIHNVSTSQKQQIWRPRSDKEVNQIASDG